MFRTSLSAVDWAGVGSKIRDFFVTLPDNDTAFYLFIAGCALLLIGILALILGISYHKKAKKAQKTASAKKTAKHKNINSEPVQQFAPRPVQKPEPRPVQKSEPITVAAQPVAAPITVSAQPVAAPITVAAQPVAAPITVETEDTAPVYTAPSVSENEQHAEPYPEEVKDIGIPSMPYGESEPIAEPESPVDNVPESEPVTETVEEGIPFIAPVNDEVDDKISNPVNSEEISMEDGGWKSAKIVNKRKTKKEPKGETAVKEEKVAPIIKAPKKKESVAEEPKSESIAEEPKAEAKVEEQKSEPIVEEKKAAPKKAAPKKAAPKKAAPKKAAPKKAAPKKEPEKKETVEKVNEYAAEPVAEIEKPKVVGKFLIEPNGSSFQFSLYANNGQLLYESREYASAASCKSGVGTFKKNVAICDYRIDEDKNGGYKYIFKKGNSIYIGETYSTAKAAESSAESVKRFAPISDIVK